MDRSTTGPAPVCPHCGHHPAAVNRTDATVYKCMTEHCEANKLVWCCRDHWDMYVKEISDAKARRKL